MKYKSIATEVFNIEANEILNLSKKLDDNFNNSVDSILESKGKLIICGMGKSGIIGKKIAATMASTGTPSFFLHPGEAYHGDLGMIEKDDIVLLISNSGETDEVLKLIPFLKRHGNTTISMTGKPLSTLAKNTNFHLNIAVEKEACPLQLAPTSSTTATLVMGDALAVTLMKLRNFKDKDFAQFHPGGSLGRRLLTNVSDVMKKDNLPICTPDCDTKEIIHCISSGGYGLAVIIENTNIVGVITDGDIRRVMESDSNNFFNLYASDFMTKTPKLINQNEKLTNASDYMNENKVNALVVVDDNKKLAGIIQMYDLGI